MHISSSPCLTDLTVFFDPAAYSVPEGENQVLVLRTDNEFAVLFTVDVTLRDGTAVGKYMECILPCTLHFFIRILMCLFHYKFQGMKECPKSIETKGDISVPFFEDQKSLIPCRVVVSALWGI